MDTAVVALFTSAGAEVVGNRSPAGRRVNRLPFEVSVVALPVRGQ